MHGHLGALRAHHRRHRHQVPCPSLHRRTAYSALTRSSGASAIAAGGGLKAWPELVVALVQALDSGDVNAADGALDAFYKARACAADRAPAASSHATPQVCEEVPAQVDEDVPGLQMRPAALLVPRLLTLFGRRVALAGRNEQR